MHGDRWIGAAIGPTVARYQYFSSLGFEGVFVDFIPANSKDGHGCRPLCKGKEFNVHAPNYNGKRAASLFLKLLRPAGGLMNALAMQLTYILLWDDGSGERLGRTLPHLHQAAECATHYSRQVRAVQLVPKHDSHDCRK